MSEALAPVTVLSMLFFVAWMVREWQWVKEREKLLDRIMAKSLPELNYEERKKEALRSKPAVRPFPSDADMADWEKKHQSQISENAAELDSALTALRRKTAETIQVKHAAGVSHGS